MHPASQALRTRSAEHLRADLLAAALLAFNVQALVRFGLDEPERLNVLV